ncbi:gastrula zinc finger protein XlCGF17.1-like [Pieris napi]|uniref:gastrula zinc finger protein XlCGF17.1-like n=1 Tax=Pieris napi TaxID=78633 RepID=UPI001FB89E81|nr:gastrula zinc finger protein XlCGF17.1-like [Pieris napi]
MTDCEEAVKPKKFQCEIEGCRAQFDRPNRLLKHRLTHSNIKPYSCIEDGCGKAYTSKNHLERHINTAHRSYNDTEMYSCPTCFKQYSNRQNLKRHYKIHHVGGVEKLSCEICHISFKRNHQLRTHMYRHTGVKDFSCPMCPKQFISMTEQKKHIRNHKEFTCEHCYQKFTRWLDLVQHRQTSHQSEEYICDHCGKIFKQRQHIIRHLKIQHYTREVSLFICPYENCSRNYSRNSNLKQHILVKHQGLTFNCHLCEAKLSTKAKLKEHIMRHSRPTPYKPPKTLLTGRKKRKDAYIPRSNTALKLAGLPCPILENPALPDVYVEREENASVNQLLSVGM